MRVGIAGAAILLFLLPAQAHDWYAPDCCSGRDCRPLEDIQVKELPGGWGTPDGIVGYRDRRIKASMDGRFHICSINGNEGGPFALTPKHKRTVYIRCLYVPPRGM